MTKRNSINWAEVQKFYDLGNTIADICDHYNISASGVASARRRGKFKTRNKSECQTSKTIIDITRINELVKLFNNGYSLRDLIQNGYTQVEYNWARDNKYLISRNPSEAAKLARIKYGYNRPGPAAIAKLSSRQSLNNTGGRCKWYEVAGQKVQGTWERNIASKLEELGIEWYKPKINADILTYNINGKTRSYTPDMYLPQYDIYLEIKGYWWGNDREKMDAVLNQYPEKKILIIMKKEYEKIMDGEQVW